MGKPSPRLLTVVLSFQLITTNFALPVYSVGYFRFCQRLQVTIFGVMGKPVLSTCYMYGKWL